MTQDNNISELSKWMISFWSALLFLLIASPFMFKLTGGLFKSLGLKTQRNGCPNWIGLLIHAVVFALLIRLMMMIPLPGVNNKEAYDSFSPEVWDKYNYNFYDGYTGLANPAGMMNYNTAYLRAKEARCDECVKAASACMRDPFSIACIRGVDVCNQTCENVGVIDAINAGQCNSPIRDYFPKGSC